MNWKRWIGPVLGGVLLVVLILYMGGVFRTDRIAPGRAPEPTGIGEPEQRGAAVSAKRTVWYEAVGTVRSQTEASVAPQVTGRIVELHVREGDRVAESDPIATLDNDEFKARFEQARSGLAAAKAIQEQATANYERVERLFAQNAQTQEQLEAAEAMKKQADAGVTAAEQKLEEARVAVGYTSIVSPMDGIVARREADPGDLAWPGKTLVVVYDPERMRLEASVREGLTGAVKVGSVVQVLLTALEKSLEGTVDEVVPSADPVSRSFLVKVDLPPTEGLYSGMFGKLRISIGERDTILIPQEALTTVGQLSTVLVLQEDRWARRYVTVGNREGGSIEVLSGLSGGETIGWGESDGAS